MNSEFNINNPGSNAASGNESSGASRRELRKARQKAEKKAQKEAAKEAKRAKRGTPKPTAKADADKTSGTNTDNDSRGNMNSFARDTKSKAAEKKAWSADNSSKDDSQVEKVKANKNRKRKKKSKILIVILIIALVLGAIAGTLFIMDKNGMLNINTIVVNGNNYYTDKYIIKASKVKKGTEILSVKRESVEDKVKKLPYVKSVSVQRQLPHTLVINVVERAPQYAIYAGGYYIYLDKELYMLAKSNDSGDNRIIEGFVPEKIVMGEKFETEDSENFKLAIKLSKEMEKNGVKIFKISKRDNFLRVFLSENIVCEGSYESILANVGRVDAILQSLSDQKINRATIYFGDNDYIAFSPRIE